MDALGIIDVLVSKKNNDILVIKYEKQKKGTLEAWFAESLYHLAQEDLLNLDMSCVFKIIGGTYDVAPTTMEALKPSKKKTYKIVVVAIYTNKVSISPYGKIDKYGGGIGKYTVDVVVPDDGENFHNKLLKAIEDAG